MALSRTWVNSLKNVSSPTANDGSVWAKESVIHVYDDVDAELARIQQKRVSWTPFCQTAEGAAMTPTFVRADYQILGDQLCFRLYVGNFTVPAATNHIRLWLPVGINPVEDNIDEIQMRVFVGGTAFESGYGVVRTWPYLEVHRMSQANFPTGSTYAIGQGSYFFK